MPSANEKQILALVTELDRLVPTEGAILFESVVPACWRDNKIITGNRLGYLRLGIQFLKGAFEDPADSSRTNEIPMNLGDIVGLESICYSFERREDLSPESVRHRDAAHLHQVGMPPRKESRYGLLRALVHSLALLLALVGLLAAAAWASRLT